MLQSSTSDIAVAAPAVIAWLEGEMSPSAFARSAGAFEVTKDGASYERGTYLDGEWAQMVMHSAPTGGVPFVHWILADSFRCTGETFTR